MKVLGRTEEFIHVECYGEDDTAAIDGFVPSDLLFDDALDVSSPFVNLNVKTATTALFYADSAMTITMQYVFSYRCRQFLVKRTPNCVSNANYGNR